MPSPHTGEITEAAEPAEPVENGTQAPGWSVKQWKKYSYAVKQNPPQVLHPWSVKLHGIFWQLQPTLGWLQSGPFTQYLRNVV